MKSSVSSENVPTFATLLRRYRRAAGLTQEQLAERARLSARAISSLERGVNHYPRRETLQLLIAALELDEEQQHLLVASRKASTAETVTVVGFSSHLAESADDALGKHIAHLRVGEHHLALADALLVRAMIAIRKHCLRAATDDLDEALALAQAMPYPVAELKAHYLYGRFYTATGDCAKARVAYANALAICEQFDEDLYQLDIVRSLVAPSRMSGEAWSSIERFVCPTAYSLQKRD